MPGRSLFFGLLTGLIGAFAALGPREFPACVSHLFRRGSTAAAFPIGLS